ncbi:MAG: hypothetical protein IJQ72_01180 [Bacilli bacterium]|nr:hypothetical protein [Bacilli bacterium]
MSKVTYKDGKHINYYDPPQKKKKMWWRYLLMWFSGVFSAFLIVGVVALILSTSFTSGEVLTMFGVNVNAVLQPYYQGMSILKLATTLPTLKYETLGDIYKITPMVKDVFESTINPILEKEIHFEYNWEEICTKPFKLPVEAREDGSVDVSEDLPTYLGRAIKEGVYLKDFITNAPDLVNLFLYPKDENGDFDYDDPYCLMDFIAADNNFFNNIINSIKIKDVVKNPEGNALLDYIGDWSINDFDNDHINSLSIGLFLDPNSTDPLIKELSTWTVADLKAGTKFNSLSLGLFLDQTSTDPFIQEISTWTVADLKEGSKIDDLAINLFLDQTSTDPIIVKLGELKIKDLKDEDTIKDLFMTLKLEEIIKVSSSTPQILVTLINKHYTINDLLTSNLYQDLTIKDVFDITDNRLLEALKDKSLSDIEDEDTILSLKLGDVLPTTEDGDTIIDKFADKTLGELSSLDIHTVKLTDIFSEEEIQNNNNKILKALVKSNPNITIGDLTNASCIQALKLTDILSDSQIAESSILEALVDLDCSIGELSSNLDTLTLGNVLGITSTSLGVPRILRALANTQIKDLTNRINTLTLQEMIDIDVDDPSTPLLMKTLAGKTIDELNAYLPHIKLGDVMDFSSYPNLNNDTVKNTEINDFTTLINTLKNHLKLKDVVDIDVDDPDTPKLLKTLADEYLKDLPDRLGSLKLNEIMSIGPSSHPLLKALGGYSFGELEGVIPTLTLGDVLDIGPSSHPLLKALQIYSLTELESAIPSLELGNLITINDDSPKVLQSLEHTSLSNLASSISDLTLSQLVDIDVDDPDTPQIMIALKDVKILDGTSLTAKITSLKLNDIYKESDCVGVFKYLWDDNDDGDLLITNIPGAVNNLPLVTILEDYIYDNDVNKAKYYDEIDDVYYSYSELVGDLSPTGHEVKEYKRIHPIYWFLLTDSTESFTDDEKYYVLGHGLHYTINSGLENLTINFTYHMQSETLYDLYDAGVIDQSVLNRSDLDKEFMNGTQREKVGNLTMSEFLSFCISLLPNLPPLP